MSSPQLVGGWLDKYLDQVRAFGLDFAVLETGSYPAYKEIAKILCSKHYDVYTMSRREPLFETDNAFIWEKYPKAARVLSYHQADDEIKPPYPEIPIPLRIAYGMAVLYLQRTNTTVDVDTIKMYMRKMPVGGDVAETLVAAKKPVDKFEGMFEEDAVVQEKPVDKPDYDGVDVMAEE